MSFFCSGCEFWFTTDPYQESDGHCFCSFECLADFIGVSLTELSSGRRRTDGRRCL